MMNLETIVAINQDIGRSARRQKLQPYVPDGVADIEAAAFSIPNFGTYVPRGWERVEGVEWFADKTGWGRDDESAMTRRQFLSSFEDYVAEHPGHGFAIVEEGEFQLYVGTFRRKERSVARKAVEVAPPIIRSYRKGVEV